MGDCFRQNHSKVNCKCEGIIAERAARADREKYLAVLKRVPDAYPVGGDEIVEKVTRDNR